MKLLIRLSILALAAVGARTLFERLRPRVSGATGSGNLVSETLTPAVRDAATTVKDASAQAAHDVADASTQAAHDVADATRQAAGNLASDLEDAVSGTNPPTAPVPPTA